MKTYLKAISRPALVAFCAAVLLTMVTAGCQEKSDETTDRTSKNVGAPTANADSRAMAANADNSAKNIRDRDGANLTPGDQSNNPGDRDITQKVRKMLVSGTNNASGTNFSMAAQNVKIITVDGKVTLRGPVKSDAEKMGVEAIAKSVAGEGNVNDQLEVKSLPDSTNNTNN